MMVKAVSVWEEEYHKSGKKIEELKKNQGSEHEKKIIIVLENKIEELKKKEMFWIRFSVVGWGICALFVIMLVIKIKL